MARGRTIPTFDPPPPSRQARDRRKPARNLSSSYRVIAVSIPTLPNESGADRDAVREDCVGRSQLEPYHLHPPVHRYRTPLDIRAFVPRNAGFSSPPSSPYRSPRDEKAVFTRPSLHRKIPFLTRVSETSSMTGWGVGSSVPSKPQIPARTVDRPFLWGFSAVSFRSFGLRLHLLSLR